MMKYVLLFVIVGSIMAIGSANAQYAARVKSEGSKVWIDGVEKLQWGKSGDCTYIGTLTAFAHYLGDDVSYDYLMGTSGMAFRVHKWVKGWCPSSGCAGPGYSVVGNALEVLGYKFDWRGWYEGKPASEAMAAMREPIMKSIDKGYPVMALDMDDVLITGYSDGGKKLICRTYFDKDGEYTSTDKWPWCISAFEEKGKPKDRKEAVKNSLKIAQEMANTEKFGDYYSGWKAYDEWIAGLEKDESPDMHGNAFPYAVLYDCRSSAARYLMSVKDVLGEGSRPHIIKAAGIYGRIAKTLDGGRKYAPYPWDLKDGKTWTKETRQNEADVLKKVMELEKQAVGELKSALEKAN